MKKILFKGCGTAIATPFTDSGVNVKEFARLIEFQIQQQADAIIVCGTTGESSTMTKEEKEQAIRCALETANKRVPIIVGTGSNNTAQAVENSKLAESLGADALLVVTPYYNKCTQAGLIQHYQEIAHSVSIPIILYSVPSRTGVNIEPKTCLALSKIPNIVAIKEASGNLSQVADIAHLCGDELTIYSGNDDQVLPILSLGGLGVISVLSNVKPKFTHDMVMDFLTGDIVSAKQKQLQALPLIHALFSETNPIPVKCALNLSGYDFGIPRLPLTEMSLEKQETLNNLISSC
jgi:4-hydroxy-tetrahydrodipicolinate synthase